MQSPGSFRLIVRRGPQPNQVYELNKDVVAIGRDITNDIVINDPEISRHHCRMTRTAGGYMLEDVGSTNGSFVNGQRLNGARPLNGGDLLSLGETVTLGYDIAVSAEAGGMQAMPGGQQAAGYSQPPSYVPNPAATMPPGQIQGQQQGQSAPGQSQQPYYGQNPTGNPNPAQGGQPNPYAPPGQQGNQGNYGGYQQPGQMGQQASGQQPGQPGAYGGYQEQYPAQRQAGASRWVFIGCGCLVLLCIISIVVALLVIDNSNAWCTTPGVRTIVDTIFNSCP